MPDCVTEVIPQAVPNRAIAKDAKPIKILQLGLNWFDEGSGGLDRVFADFARFLPTENVHVTGLVVQPPNVAELTQNSIRPFAKEGAGLLQRMAGARRKIRAASSEADVIVPHFALHIAAALPLSTRPIVAHFHGPWAQESAIEGSHRSATLARRSIERFVYTKAERIIVLSEAFAGIVVDQYRVKRDRLRVVRGAIDTQRFDHGLDRDACRQVVGWPTDRLIILAVRRLCARMGIETLIDAFSTFSKSHSDALLIIAGRGPFETGLKARVDELELGNKVRFVGFVPDDVLPLAYSAADVHIMPSLALEGFGLSAAESLAAGTPCIVTPVGGLPEVVSALSHQLVLPGTSAAIIASALSGIARGTMPLPSAQECRAYAKRSFSLARAAKEAAAIYREVA